MQIFASTLKNGSCPLIVPECSENKDGLCVTGSQPNKVITKIRSLNFSKKKSKVEKAESSISFTSFPKTK